MSLSAANNKILLLQRKVTFLGIAVFTLGVVLMFAPSVSFAIATPAQLCTNDAFNGCWRDANNSGSSDNPVVIANHCSGSCPAQGIEAIDQHTQYQGNEVYQLRFLAHTNLCIGVSNNDGNAENRGCGAHGTAWARTPNSEWTNRAASEDDHQQIVACAGRTNGEPLQLCAADVSGDDKVFTFQ